ncbi:hypothetical protein J6590_001349 [Homalodisca vitripennis]|nr:hypothetical protein J6590_001349 [Homalodisca vitripennis]
MWMRVTRTERAQRTIRGSKSRKEPEWTKVTRRLPILPDLGSPIRVSVTVTPDSQLVGGCQQCRDVTTTVANSRIVMFTFNGRTIICQE